MTKLKSRPVKSGAVIVTEYEKAVGFNREEATVNLTADSQVGLVLKDDGDGTYSPVVAADVATISDETLAIFIDDYAYDKIGQLSAATDVAGVAILKGKSGVMIGDANLSFGNSLSGAQTLAVIAELEAQGIQVTTQVAV